MYDQHIKSLEKSPELDKLYREQNESVFENIPENFKTKEFDDIYRTYMKSAEKIDDGVKIKLANDEEVEGHYLIYGM